MTCSGVMMHRRDRSAQRADKFWKSVWLQQMVMWQRPLTFKKAYGRTKEIHGNKENPNAKFISRLPTQTRSL